MYMEEGTLRQIAQSISSELQNAALHKPSSFSYIHNSIRTTKSPPEKILVLVIGGSVFKKALCSLKDNTVEILHSMEKPQPTLHTKSDFLQFAAAEIDSTIPHIAINFAYPVTPLLRNGKLDGTLISGMKENRFEGLIGELVGKNLEEYLLQKHSLKVHISLANDTICLLLSGLGIAEREKLSAMVIGTGLNSAFFSDDNTTINCEAANFDKFTPSEEVVLLDKDSVSPGKALFEKEIAGGYLFEQYNRKMIKHASRFRRIYSTKELDIIASSETKEGIVARELLNKSASFSASLLAGISLYKKSDLVCIMEGSLFWKGYHYKETFEQTLSLILPNHTIKLVKIKDSPLIGAARLLL